MTTSDKAWDDMGKLVNKFYQMPDAEPFRVEVDWKSLGLYDYPQIIKHPMDLGKVKKKIQSRGYKTLYDAADDVRLVWTNCMTYNADGSDFYILAQNLSKKFEDRFTKLLSDHSMSLTPTTTTMTSTTTTTTNNTTSSSSTAAGGATTSTNATSSGAGGGTTGSGAAAAGAGSEVSLEEKRSFAKSLYKLTKDELGKILVTLDEKCPAALVKNATEDEVELNVDKITQPVFAELVQYVSQCQQNHSSKHHKNSSSNNNNSSSSNANNNNHGGSSSNNHSSKSKGSKPSNKKQKT